MICRGASERVAEAGPKDLSLLWQHRSGRPIGRIESPAEGARSLRVIGCFTAHAADAAEAATLVRDGAVGAAEESEH